ncbi:family 20 glycosylhydrolase [Pseudoduganella sp. RAF53_2]|uniref:family 20 glycosylhydrolase n=1 Tax=unclassified Pseudoduganella TaxID=2637179 RepID=UPI003F9C5B25
MPRSRRGFFALAGGLLSLALGVAITVPATPAAATPTAGVSSDAGAFGAGPLHLRWELLRNEVPPQGPGRALARLTISSDKLSLPTSGWALYFNVMDGLAPQSLGNGLALEQVSGQLFRLRPVAGFAGLAPGASVAADFLYPGPLTNTVKAPAGPYLAFDNQPESGAAITSYEIAPLLRPEQLNAGPHAPAIVTPEDWYARNSAIADIAPDALPPVFPSPQHAERGAGMLHLAAMPMIDAPPALRNEAVMATAVLAPYFGAMAPGTAHAPAGSRAGVRGGVPATGAVPAGSASGVATTTLPVPPATTASAAARARLTLRVAEVTGSASPEAYVLAVDPAQGITVQGATPSGVFRGLQSLRQLLPLMPAATGGVELSELKITDAPRFAYRGVMLDVARNFQRKEVIFRLLDLMARYKLNVFHFHLTDDEGWRLAIKGLPELTDFGARRGHTLSVASHLQPAYGSGPQLDDPHGSGFYTREDYIAILRYAQARHIEVIPEIEMPGHARAAVKAMEQRYRRLAASDPAAARRYMLRDPGDRSAYTSPQLYHDHVMDPGLDSTYTFIEHVVAEVASMHKEAGVPLARMHVGGDEVPAGAWEKSPASQRLKLNSTADLWDRFYDRVTGILARHGMSAYGWQELGVRHKEPNPAFSQRGIQLLVWDDVGTSADMANRLAHAGYGVVLAPATQLYFDMAYNRNPDEPGVNWAAYTELDKAFAFDPAHYGTRNILGIECTLFTETVRELDRMDYLLMPRMLALAERAWAPEQARDWSVFANQLGKRVLPRLDAERSGIAYRIAPPGLHVEHGQVLANHQLPSFALHYTLDGSVPTANSPLVTGPIRTHGLVRVAAVAQNGRVGAVSEVRLP